MRDRIEINGLTVNAVVGVLTCQRDLTRHPF